ncbi:MAG TPA: 4-hydroxy-tetrahydrodipicolinate synthase [Rhodospirillaceae bacterium]|nr:4-hydroxy-tetrahydrodipicolinate synthase [Rhodospirillaceae bacterium]
MTTSTTQPNFTGSLTALITPFKNGEVDYKAYQDFVAWQINEGTNGFVPCGTTGEAPTLSEVEMDKLIRACVETAKGKASVMAGCGSNSTAHAVHLTQMAEKAGADGALQVVPYYNKPSQEGLYQHFKAIHDNSGLPIFIYNIPGRSIVNMTPDTMARLAALPRIVGVKDATGDLGRPFKTRQLCGAEFIQLSGNDDTALPFLAQGGHGCISVVSNIAPSLCAKMHAAWKAGDVATAQKMNDRLMPLIEVMFIETSPSPVKYAASLIGKGKNELRLPMVPVTKASEKLIKDAMVNSILDMVEAA